MRYTLYNGMQTRSLSKRRDVLASWQLFFRALPGSVGTAMQRCEGCFHRLSLRVEEIRKRPALGGRITREIDHRFIHVTPTPPLGRIVSFHDRMARRVEMGRRMT